jgi:hypothetical protein
VFGSLAGFLKTSIHNKLNFIALPSSKRSSFKAIDCFHKLGMVEVNLHYEGNAKHFAKRKNCLRIGISFFKNHLNFFLTVMATNSMNMQNSNNLTTAHSLLHGGLATEAVEFLANIVAKDPQCVEVRVRLYSIYYFDARTQAWHTKAVAHSKIQPTQWQEAIEALEKCISLHPERRSAYALDIKELGNVLYK